MQLVFKEKLKEYFHFDEEHHVLLVKTPSSLDKYINPFVAVGWFINHYFFVKFFFLEEKIIPKIFQTFGWCIYPVSVTLWAPWLGDFDNLNLFYRKIKIEKMPKFETLLATNGLSWWMREERGEQLGSCLERDYWNWLSCLGSGSQPPDSMIVISALDLSSFVTVHVTSGPSLVHSPLPSLVTLASHWSRARWQQSWQICPALIGWPPLNHGQFLKLWRVKMPAMQCG